MRIARALLRSVRRARRAVADLMPGGPGRASRQAERDLTPRLLAQLPAGAPTTGPRVAVVILNRDGVGHLRRLLPALESTAYSEFEIVLIDNASRDGSVEYVRGFRTRHPLRIVENAENLSFSVANNSALQHSDAELLLFLNNDVRPMEPHWLGWMVESVMTAGRSACGARLVVPRRRIPRSKRAGMQGDLELQHTGIQFVSIDGMPRPRNIGGPDPGAPGLVAVQEGAAATAACLLIRRDAFIALGGFDPAYVYGYEDVDLCLRLRAGGGRILVDGRAVLWHDESSTRRRDHSTAAKVQQRENRAVFYGRWGRSLFRDVLRDRLDARHFLSTEPLSCGIAVSGEPSTQAVALRDALTPKGWAADLLVTGQTGWPGSADVVVAMDPRVDVRELPRHVIKIAWVADGAESWVATPWIDEFDLLLVGDEEALEAIRGRTSHVAHLVPPADGPIDAVAGAIEAALRSWMETRRVGILVRADSWKGAAASSEYQMARSLQREFERRGLPATVRFQPSWKAAASTRDDLVIQFPEGEPLRRRPGQMGVLIVRDQSQAVTGELNAPSEFVLAASDQATDGDRVDEILRLVDELQPAGAR
ncbi:MAG: glycosyltransferase family 2 protein [Chloroflexota bacterium]|nr:glycosyltransferase family 2 protein [Chloroflexota bacterium]